MSVLIRIVDELMIDASWDQHEVAFFKVLIFTIYPRCKGALESYEQGGERVGTRPWILIGVITRRKITPTGAKAFLIIKHHNVTAFATKGFDGTTLDDIAVEAGVNKAMVAYYFSDKAGLFQAILQDAVEFILLAVVSDVGKNASAREQLTKYITALGQMMARRPAFPCHVVARLYVGALSAIR